MQNKSAPPYIFRPATIQDIPELAELNLHWQFENLSSSQRTKGFLSVRFLPEEFEILIKNDEVVVTSFNDSIIGYYLLNNFCSNKKMEEAKQVIAGLKVKGVINVASTVGLGAQVLIDENYRGRALFRAMLDVLCSMVSCKYEYLYSSVSRQNTISFHVHTREGWTVVSESDHCYYILLNLKTIISI